MQYRVNLEMSFSGVIEADTEDEALDIARNKMEVDSLGVEPIEQYDGEWYFIYEDEYGETFAVCAPNIEEANKIAEEALGNIDLGDKYELIDSFIANEYGDNLIDAMGLDVL